MKGQPMFRTMLLVLASLVCGATTSSAVEPDEIELVVGDTHLLQIDLKRAALGNGKIVSLSTPERGQLLILAERPGSTLAQLWLRDGTRKQLRVRVRESDLARRLAEVQRLLDAADGVTARIVGERILLEGSDVSVLAKQRAAGVASLFPGAVLDLVDPLGHAVMIQFDARLVEIRRDHLQSLGIRWSTTAEGPSVSAQIGVGPDVASVSLLSVLSSQLDLLQQKGLAYTIAEPMLSCRSGGVARFVSGGEVPLPIVNGVGATDVQFKEYGIILEVRPQAERSGTIAADVDVELSQIDASVRVGDFPGFLKRRSTTAVNMQAGETIVISGLVARESSQDRHAVPGLGSLPVAGKLFSSRRRQSRETELLILLTPRRIAALSVPPGGDTVKQDEPLRRATEILQQSVQKR